MLRASSPANSTEVLLSTNETLTSASYATTMTTPPPPLPSSPPPTTLSTPRATTITTEQTAERSYDGHIVGIVTGVLLSIVFVVVVLLLNMCIWRRRSKQNKLTTELRHPYPLAPPLNMHPPLQQDGRSGQRMSLTSQSSSGSIVADMSVEAYMDLDTAASRNLKTGSTKSQVYQNIHRPSTQDMSYDVYVEPLGHRPSSSDRQPQGHGAAGKISTDNTYIDMGVVPPPSSPQGESKPPEQLDKKRFSGSPEVQVSDYWRDVPCVLEKGEMSDMEETWRKATASITENDSQHSESCSADEGVTSGKIKEVSFSRDDIERFGNRHLQRHLSSEMRCSILCYGETPETDSREERMSGRFLRSAREEAGNGPVEDQPQSLSQSLGWFTPGESSDVADDFPPVSLRQDMYAVSTDPERDNSFPGWEFMDEMKAERTSSYILNQNNSATKSVHPTFCPSWQFSGDFCSSGGVLQGERSDVRLEVPEGTLEKGTILTITGAISTNLEAVHKKLQLPQFEYIASPVAEYICENGCMFQKPVWIILPHFLPPGVTNRVCVYCASRDQDGQLHIEKMQAKAEHSNSSEIGITKSGSFFFDENNNIRILTHHFSAYFCTHCETETVIPDLWVELYAKHIQVNGNERYVDVRLEIWDRRVNTRDFRENHPDAGSLSFSDMQRVDGMELPALTGAFDSDKIAIGARLVLSPEQEAVWMHRIRPDENSPIYPAETTLPLKSILPCNCRSSMPKRKDWRLTNKPGKVPDGPFGPCVIYVGYAETETASSFIFLTNPERITFDFFIGLSASSQQIPGGEGYDRGTPLKTLSDLAKSLHAAGSRTLKRSPSDTDSALGSVRSETLTVERPESPSEGGACGGLPPVPCTVHVHSTTFVNSNFTQTSNTSYNNKASIGKTRKVDFQMPGENKREGQVRQGLEDDQRNSNSDTPEPYEPAEMNYYPDHPRLPPYSHPNGHADEPAHVSHRDPEMHHGSDQDDSDTGRDHERPQPSPFTRRGHHVENRAIVAESRLQGSGNQDASLPFPCPVSLGHQESGALV